MNRRVALLISLSALMASINVSAGNPLGGIIYLGKYADDSRSFWLSQNTVPSAKFTVSSDNGAFSEDYSKSGAGLHFTFSPVVLTGSDGTHSFTEGSGDGDPYLIGSAEQTGGFIIPPPGGNNGGGGGGTDGGDGGDGGGDIGDLILKSQELLSLNNMHHGQSISGRIVADYFDRAVLATETGANLANDSSWNLWFDTKFYDVRDNRNHIAREADSKSFLLGMDTDIGNQQYLGFAVGIDITDDDVFSGSLNNDVTAYTIGPYYGFNISENWVGDLWLGYTYSDIETDLLGIKGDNKSHSFFSSLNATGQYWLNDDNTIALYPKLGIYYAYTEVDKINMAGNIQGSAVSFDVDNHHYTTGTLLLSTELAKTYTISADKIVTSFMTLTARNNFDRPTDGSNFLEQLGIKENSRWLGSIDIGAKGYFSGSTTVDVRASYSGLFEKELDIFSMHVSANWMF